MINSIFKKSNYWFFFFFKYRKMDNKESYIYIYIYTHIHTLSRKRTAKKRKNIMTCRKYNMHVIWLWIWLALPCYKEVGFGPKHYCIWTFLSFFLVGVAGYKKAGGQSYLQFRCTKWFSMYNISITSGLPVFILWLWVFHTHGRYIIRFLYFWNIYAKTTLTYLRKLVEKGSSYNVIYIKTIKKWCDMFLDRLLLFFFFFVKKILRKF